ncbi:MAG: tetratricopeptide repeat protein [Deltaproteobacteria bacterium]|jgi:hypothetical protein|nr:tetratricopeptide repeat protein [Deltaproteobacteria bacterium]
MTDPDSAALAVHVLAALLAFAVALRSAPLRAMGRKAAGKKKGASRRPKPSARCPSPGYGAVARALPKWSFPGLGPVLEFVREAAEGAAARGEHMESLILWSRLGLLVRDIFGRRDPRAWAAMSRSAAMILCIGGNPFAAHCRAREAGDGLREAFGEVSGDTGAGAAFGEEIVFAMETVRMADTAPKPPVPNQGLDFDWDNLAVLVEEPAGSGSDEGDGEESQDGEECPLPCWALEDISGRKARKASLRADLAVALSRFGDMDPSVLDLKYRYARELAGVRGRGPGYCDLRVSAKDLDAAYALCGDLMGLTGPEGDGGTGPARKAEIRLLMAEILFRRGCRSEAFALIMETRASVEKELGYSHELYPVVHAELADSIRDIQPEEAETLYTDVLTWNESGRADFTHGFLAIQARLVNLLLSSGNPSLGIARVLVTAAIMEKLYGSGNAEAAQLWASAGLAFRRLGDFRAAAVLLGRAASRTGEVLGAGHPQTVDLVNAHAATLLLGGDSEAARRTLAPALAAAELMPRGREADAVRKAARWILSLIEEGDRLGGSGCPPGSPRLPLKPLPGRDPFSSLFQETAPVTLAGPRKL